MTENENKFSHPDGSSSWVQMSLSKYSYACSTGQCYNTSISSYLSLLRLHGESVILLHSLPGTVVCILNPSICEEGYDTSWHDETDSSCSTTCLVPIFDLKCCGLDRWTEKRREQNSSHRFTKEWDSEAFTATLFYHTDELLAATQIVLIGGIPCLWTRNAFAVPHSWPTCISLQSYLRLPVNTYLILLSDSSILNLKSFVIREKLLLGRKIKMCTNHDDFEAMLSRQKRGRGEWRGRCEVSLRAEVFVDCLNLMAYVD